MNKSKLFLIAVLFMGVMFLPSKYFFIKVILTVISVIFGVVETRNLLKQGVKKSKIYFILILVGVPLLTAVASAFYL